MRCSDSTIEPHILLFLFMIAHAKTAVKKNCVQVSFRCQNVCFVTLDQTGVQFMCSYTYIFCILRVVRVLLSKASSLRLFIHTLYAKHISLLHFRKICF